MRRGDENFLNETVTANARRWVDEWRVAQRERGKPDSMGELGREAAKAFKNDVREKLRKKQPNTWEIRFKALYDQIPQKSSDPGRVVFDADDLEALARVVGLSPLLLLDPSYQGPETGTAATLFWGLDHVLSREQAATLVRNICLINERDGLYDLAEQILEALGRSKSAADASYKIYGLIEQSKRLFDPPKDPSTTRKSKGRKKKPGG